MTDNESTPSTSQPSADKPAAADPFTLRERYQEVYDFSPEAQLLTDASGIILEANLTAVALFCCPKEFLIGKPLAMFAVGADRQRVSESLLSLHRDAASDAFELHLARKDEEPREVGILVRPSLEHYNWPEYRKYHWFIRDNTDSKQEGRSRADLLRGLASAQEDERRRLARDLHDSLGQTVTALSLGLSSLKNSTELPAAAFEQLGEIERLVDGLGRQLHELATRLRPAALDDLGLEAALRHLIRDWSSRARLVADFHSTLSGRFPPEIETALYRVVQESLTNVARHAGPCRASVIIERLEQEAVAVIEDTGAGFQVNGSQQRPAPGAEDRLGILGMRERVTLLGGTLQIESEPGRGTTVIARIPLP